MRAFTSIALASSLLLTTRAQLIPYLTSNSASSDDNSIMPEPNQQQQPLHAQNPGIQLPPPTPADDGDDNKDRGDQPPVPSGPVILSDVITTERSINIFAGFTRDIETVEQRLDNSNINTTLLAPRNGAITALPRKPWEDPREYAAMGTEAYAGDDGVARAHANLRKFVEAHVVTASPWAEGEKVRTMGGGMVWWERKGETTVIHPGGIEVDRVVSRVANGEIWIVKDVMNYAA